MKLHHRDFGGSGTPILILHALFASSKNWVTVGQRLSRHGHALALDLRNHGDSPHTDSHSLADLAADLEQWIAENLAAAPVLLGHSMGGLAAMAYALAHPGEVRALIVVDIAPRFYGHRYEGELAALRLDLSRCRTRREVDEALTPLIPDPAVRSFFQMSVEKTEAPAGGFRWKINGAALAKSALLRGEGFEVLDGGYEGPTLFVAGGASGFITPADHPLIRARFPAALIHTIPGADHWLHHTAAEAFRAAVEAFLRSL
jgi:pimeloyl-ACP methyl ester carboxylesterase